jgi:ApeA N-terminal domain 1
VSGYFWVPEKPDARVWGAFSQDGGHKPEAVLASGVVSDPRVVRTNSAGGRAFLSSAAATVGALQPITLQGQFDTGHAVTLVNAYNHGRDGYFFGSPHYKADYAVVGERHVSGVDQLFSAIRFRFGDPYWLGHLREGKASAVGSDGSALGVETSDDGNWLVYTAAAPATLRQLKTTAVLGCLALAELALDQDFAARDTHVRVNNGDPWLSVHGPEFDVPPNEFDADTLLPREELTGERFARWIPFNDTLDGLASVVARPIKAPLQTQVLVVTPLVEGLHRRMPKTFEQSKFAGASPTALKQIKESAWRAARCTATNRRRLDARQVHAAMMSAVSHFDDVDYLQRATDVVTKVCAALPEIAESVADLPIHLRDARNEMAHEFPLDHEREPLEVRHLRWSVVASATPWLLRGLLLLEAGIDPAVLHDRHLAYRRFLTFRANVAQSVGELGHEQPPSGR